MDYDKTTIAASYDAARDYAPNVLGQWLNLIAAHLPVRPRLIVDVGCGTGRFTCPLADRFQSRVIGIDPSQKMLEVARKKANKNVEVREAPAEQLPLEDGCADVVFMSMILHHLNDRARAVRECARILRAGGRVCVRNSTRDSTYPQRHFFPGIIKMIEHELPSRDEIVAMFEYAGLQLSAYQRVSHPLATSWNELAEKLAKRADSFLARLPDADFEAGMAALRAHARHCDPHQAVSEDIDFFVFEQSPSR
jgi:ubiquinone/menaquinone biosynthesis C-methylase UbiE